MSIVFNHNLNTKLETVRNMKLCEKDYSLQGPLIFYLIQVAKRFQISLDV